MKKMLKDVLLENTVINDFVVEQDFEFMGRRVMHLNASRILHRKSSVSQLILLSIEDVTDRELHKRNLEDIVKKRTVECFTAQEEADKRRQAAEDSLAEIQLIKEQLEVERAYLPEEITLDNNQSRYTNYCRYKP
ncbi:hypothetical protein [Desulfobulbus alkaliphilus]|uniref:hypothetical protein n=1 Tax=Desulfobulbus alkaliphilus TaxID=869814 RepID=UPI0023DD3C05|nr:hypothetical protein [Desulfobulbus alkaliphilus]